MSNYQSDYASIEQTAEFRQELAAQRTFMARVYSWMTIGLLVTALTALAINSFGLQGVILPSNGVFITLLIVQFGVAMAMSFLLNKIPAFVAGIMFIVYSLITGITFSILFLVYTHASIYSAFFITAGMFGTMSCVGYVTKKDLTGLGSFLMMALFGLIIASIVSMFWASSGLYWIINYGAVLIFVGLTAYHTQMIKRAYAEGGAGSDTNNKVAIFGAFSLYLDFINIFIYLLRIFGDRR